MRRAIDGEFQIALHERWCTVLALACTPREDNDVKKHRLVLFLAAAAPIFLTASLARAASAWLRRYKRGATEAKAGNKFILLDFTGSDWCPWCKKFDKEILSQSQFKDYAKENLVLMEVDFPREKLQSAELKR